MSNILTDFPTRYTLTAIPDRIKKDLTIVILNINDYLKEIEKWKQNRDPRHFYYDYGLELDLSIDTKDPESIKSKIYDDRLYYYKAYHYLKLGLFKPEDAPFFKVKLSHLGPDIIYELSQLDSKDRKFVLKQAVSRIFEDINFALYHDSVSANLGVELVD